VNDTTTITPRTPEEAWFDDVFLDNLLGRAWGVEKIDAVLAEHAERIKQITPVLDAIFGDGATARCLDLNIRERKAWYSNEHPWAPGPDVRMRLRDGVPYGNPHICRSVCASYTDDKITWERSTAQCNVPVFVHEDDVTVNLQITFPNTVGHPDQPRRGQHVLLVTFRKDGRQPPCISLWYGSGEHEARDDGAGLREWFEIATGMRPEPTQG
jgi:hypothetical protein